MKIRIASRGWNGNAPADTLDDVGVGLALSWVEIVGDDGDSWRIPGDALTEAKVGTGSGAFQEVELTLYGAVEMVYVDIRGEPLPRRRDDPTTEP